MTSLVILHALGDEAAADALSGRLAARNPARCAVAAGQADLRLGAHVALIVVWSRHAQTQLIGGELGEICARHFGLVMICPIDDAPLPDELDAPDFRLIDPFVDGRTLEEAKRAHEIVAAAEKAERDAMRADIARRRHPHQERAFIGGAVTGFATTVALLGAMGATAIGAADQWMPDGSAARTGDGVPSNMPVLNGIPPAPERQAWMDPPPAVSTAQTMAAADETLAEAAARMDEMRAATDLSRARLERVADALWSPRSSDAGPSGPRPAVNVSARAAETPSIENAAPRLEVARFALFDIEPLDFAAVDDLQIGADLNLSLGARLETELEADWSARGEMRQVSYNSSESALDADSIVDAESASAAQTDAQREDLAEAAKAGAI